MKDFAARYPRAIRAVAAAANVGDMLPDRLKAPVFILQLLGTADTTGAPGPSEWNAMRTNEKKYFWGSQTVRPTLLRDMSAWAKLNGCEPTPRNTRMFWGSESQWVGCRHQALVRADYVNGLGHEWAGSTVSSWHGRAGAPDTLNYTEQIWRFFKSVP